MNIACIFITLDRSDLTLRCINQNFYNSGLNADVFLIDNGSEADNFESIVTAYPFKSAYRFVKNKGIAAAINKGIEMAKDYDAVVTLANDILMPDNWLKDMVASVKEDTGMVGIHCVEGLPAMINGVHPIQTPFGNVLIPMAAVNKVGMFNTDFDPYGMQDADYAYRLLKSGFRNYYIPGQSEHIGNDVGNGTEYRQMKDEGLAKAGAIYTAALNKYDEIGNYYLKY